MRLLILSLIITLSSTLNAQSKWFTRSGQIKFYSSTPVEDIEAINNSVSSVLDQSTGNIQFSAEIKSFVFEKALMQEHFNENYMESDEYPQAKFAGKITNMNEVDWSTPGDYEVIIEGKLTIHGETQELKVKGTFRVVDASSLKAKAEFKVKPEDYKISIPDIVREKIAKEISVTVNMEYKPLKR